MTPLQSPVLHFVDEVAHGFFGRRGGASTGIYDSLNCGYGSGDDVEIVRENRSRVAASLGVSEPRLVTAYQIHSAEVVEVTDTWVRGGGPKADGMVTTMRGIALGVLTADCTPVLFADATAGVIGSAHTGWKGAFTGIIEAVVARMEMLGAKRSRIRAGVGPCISQTSYEVGPEFRVRFMEQAGANEHYFVPSTRDAHWQFDLQAYVRARLVAADVECDMWSSCTYTNERDYFSFRRATHRGETSYGRNISAIVLKP